MGIIRRKVVEILNQKGVDIYKKDPKFFYTHHTRPKSARDIEVSNADLCGDNVGIVIQGPIKGECSFTLETVRLYKKIFPKSFIVVSTWDNEKTEYIDELRNTGVEIILNHYPEKIRGIQFINLQRETSMRGIQRIRKLSDCNYILKTRTDERIYSKNALEYLIKLLEVFPQNVSSIPKGRIITTSLCSFTNRLYNASDLCVFGYTEDVERYFSPPYDYRDHGDVIEGDDPIRYAKQRPGEIYFSTNYLESIGHKIEWTFEDSRKCFRDYYIVIDSESIDLFWFKYHDKEYHYRSYSSSGLQQMTFADWLCL